MKIFTVCCSALMRYCPCNFGVSCNITLETALERINEWTLLFEPGTAVMYSNTGFTVLGYTICTHTHTPHTHTHTKHTHTHTQSKHTHKTHTQSTHTHKTHTHNTHTHTHTHTHSLIHTTDPHIHTYIHTQTHTYTHKIKAADNSLFYT